jgi:hypothetical protein
MKGFLYVKVALGALGSRALQLIFTGTRQSVQIHRIKAIDK